MTTKMDKYFVTPEKLETTIRKIEEKKGKHRSPRSKISSFSIRKYNERTKRNQVIKKAERYMIKGTRKKLVYHTKYKNNVSVKDVCTGRIVNKFKLSPQKYRLQAMWAEASGTGSAITLEVFPNRSFKLYDYI
jgi:hypothetical protein